MSELRRRVEVWLESWLTLRLIVEGLCAGLIVGVALLVMAEIVVSPGNLLASAEPAYQGFEQVGIVVDAPWTVKPREEFYIKYLVQNTYPYTQRGIAFIANVPSSLIPVGRPTASTVDGLPSTAWDCSNIDVIGLPFFMCKRNGFMPASTPDRIATETISLRVRVADNIPVGFRTYVKAGLVSHSQDNNPAWMGRYIDLVP